jgi:hypothetical protein
MAHGYDTHTLVIDKRVLKQILDGCSLPDHFREILRQIRELAFRRITVEQFDAFCEAQPCIIWEPEDESIRHVEVRVQGQVDPKLVRITRIVWTLSHICQEQGPDLRGHEDVHHKCAHNGQSHSSRGCCINPAHIFRGDAKTRAKLHQAREILRRHGISEVSA